MNYDTKKDFEKIRKSIGYCPQNNALFDYLTVEETFDYYLRLKTLKYHDEPSNKKESNEIIQENNQINTLVNPNINSLITDKISKTNLTNQKKHLMKKFGLEKFKNTFSINLSGGNKRKLNFAIALMHNPNLILLDEPSTGVDPESRRIMWRNINEIPLHIKNFNLILSTHSMEEAEILCDTIGWMNSGNFLCIGNPEKLKMIYSPDYYISIKFKNMEDNNLIFTNNHTEKIKNNLFNNKNFSSNVDIDKSVDEDNYDAYDHLEKFIKKISYLCTKVSLNQMYGNNSFEIGIKFDGNKQAEVFCLIINLKVKSIFICI